MSKKICPTQAAAGGMGPWKYA